MSQTLFRGIVPPVPTIMDENGQLDKLGMGRLIDFLIGEGVHGFLFLGTAGEAAHMSAQQKETVTDFVIQYVNKRIPVLIGTGCPGTQETIYFSQYAEKAGADGLVIVNPSYMLLSEENMYRHFARIAESVKLPILLYNFPMLTGQDLSPQLLLRLATDFPNIVGVKDTVDQLSHIRAVVQMVKSVRPDFMVFAGFDEYLFATLCCGGDGVIPASANFAPQLTLGIYEAYNRGDMEQLKALTKRLSLIAGIYSLDAPFVNVVKEAIGMCVLDIPTHVLSPANPLTPEKRETLRSMLVKADVIRS